MEGFFLRNPMINAVDITEVIVWKRYIRFLSRLAAAV